MYHKNIFIHSFAKPKLCRLPGFPRVGLLLKQEVKDSNDYRTGEVLSESGRVGEEDRDLQKDALSRGDSCYWFLIVTTRECQPNSARFPMNTNKPNLKCGYIKAKSHRKQLLNTVSFIKESKYGLHINLALSEKQMKVLSRSNDFNSIYTYFLNKKLKQVTRQIQLILNMNIGIRY